MNKDLKRLSRRELVDIIYQLKKNEQEQQEEIALLKKELEDKRIRISTAGTIAEAAVSVTDVFSVAQKTADLYLHEISCMKEDTERECARRVEEADKKIKKILAEGKERYANLKEQYKIEYMKWQELQLKIDEVEKRIKDELYEGIENG